MPGIFHVPGIFLFLCSVHIIKKRTFVYYEEYDSYEEYILFDRFDSCISV